jgi:hypothetical protein
MHSTAFRQIKPEALAGLLIGQAIRQVAFDDPAVQAIRNTPCYTKKQAAAFESLFGNGFFLWPLHSSADDLARILYPSIQIVRDEEHAMGDPPAKVMLAATTIAAALSRTVGFLHKKELLAHDDQNNEFDRWGRPGLAIDVQTSDLWDSFRSVILRKSLQLSVPIKSKRTAASKIAVEAKQPDEYRSKQTGAFNRAGRHGLSEVSRHSIEQAIKGIWGKKVVPKGILVEQRDSRISEYQRSHGLRVTSAKTNQRFFHR